MTRPHDRWPTRRMQVTVDEDQSAFWRGLVLGVALSLAMWGVLFAVWSVLR